MNYPLINGKRNTKEEIISQNFITYIESMRMEMTTPTMDTLALKFNCQMVYGNHG